MLRRKLTWSRFRPCQVVAMRDVDLNLVTRFITQPHSDIITVENLKGKRFALAQNERRSSWISSR